MVPWLKWINIVEQRYCPKLAVAQNLAKLFQSECGCCSGQDILKIKERLSKENMLESQLKTIKLNQAQLVNLHYLFVRLK